MKSVEQYLNEMLNEEVGGNPAHVHQLDVQWAALIAKKRGIVPASAEWHHINDQIAKVAAAKREAMKGAPVDRSVGHRPPPRN
jgi:hypothetical protein